MNIPKYMVSIISPVCSNNRILTWEIIAATAEARLPSSLLTAIMDPPSPAMATATVFYSSGNLQYSRYSSYSNSNNFYQNNNGYPAPYGKLFLRHQHHQQLYDNIYFYIYNIHNILLPSKQAANSVAEDAENLPW